MRRYIISSFGSRGDMQPCLALALKLQADGRDVQVVGPPDQKPWFSTLAPSLAYISCGFDVRKMLEDQSALLRESPIKLGHFLSEVFVEQAEQQWRCFADLFDTNTTFVGSGLQFSAGHVAEARGARYLYAALLPQMFPASAWPPPLLETQRLPRWMNWLAWAGYEQLWRNILKRKIGALRKGAGLAPVRDLLGVALGKQRVLCCDPFLLPRGTPSDVTVYGAIFYSDTRRVSAEVESFLAAHSRIVYVGFGSMTDDRAEATAALIRAAARKAGVALLLSSGWAGYTVAHADDVLVIGDEPHLALFPRLSGVVHHGGAGTTHAALKSRVPQLIVAHTLDQFFWGERVARAALGPASLAKAKLTGEALAASFGALETFAANAQRVSVVEDATTRLADLICRQP